MTQYDIYAIGAALLDTEIEVNDTDLEQFGIEKGVMTLVDEARQNELIELLSDHLVASKKSSGGSAANTVIAASYFGSRGFLSCRVANDDNGVLYLDDLANAKVAFPDDSGSESGITGKCLVLITPDAERTMNTFLGNSEGISVTQIDEDALKASCYVYIEGYLVTSATGKPAAIKLRQLAEQNGVKTALSLSDPAIVEFFHEGMLEMAGEGVDLLFCNEDEALKFTKTDSLNLAIEALKTKAKAFAITRGALGSVLFDGSDLIEVAAEKVEPIDTNGAGDMFAGAFLHALSQGKNFESAGKFANKAAAKVVGQFGPRLKPEQHADLLK